MSSLLVAWSGLAAGSSHVVIGIDHLAALLPISVGRRLRAFGLGALWGVGHSAGVLAIALLGVLLRERLDLEAVGAVAERLVGVMLVALGILGIRRALGVAIHSHAHEHDGERHTHIHVHAPGDDEGTDPAHAADPALHRHRHTAFFADTLHGVAGTAHVLGVLPALALPGLGASLVYLAAFALGTVLAMGAFAAAVGAATAAARAPLPLRRTLVAASSVTVLVGLVWLAAPGLA